LETPLPGDREHDLAPQSEGAPPHLDGSVPPVAPSSDAPASDPPTPDAADETDQAGEPDQANQAESAADDTAPDRVPAETDESAPNRVPAETDGAAPDDTAAADEAHEAEPGDELSPPDPKVDAEGAPAGHDQPTDQDTLIAGDEPDGEDEPLDQAESESATTAPAEDQGSADPPADPEPGEATDTAAEGDAAGAGSEAAPRVEASAEDAGATDQPSEPETSQSTDPATDGPASGDLPIFPPARPVPFTEEAATREVDPDQTAVVEPVLDVPQGVTPAPEPEAPRRTSVMPAQVDPAPPQNTQPTAVTPLPPPAPPAVGAPTWDDAVNGTNASGPSAAGPGGQPPGVAKRIHKHAKTGAHRRRGLIWSLSAVIVLVAAATGGLLYANHYYSDKAAPGSELAGQSVAGLTADEVAAQAGGLVEGMEFTFTQDGETASGGAAELGVTSDPKAVATDVLTVAQGQPFWKRLNPWIAKPVPVEAQIDAAALGAYLDDKFITEDETTKDASVQFDPDTGLFDVIPSVTGLKTDPAPAVEAIEAYLADTAAPTDLEVKSEEDPPAITDAAAQEAADAATAALGRVITFSNGQDGADERTYQLPAGMIGAWTVFTPDTESGKIAISYDPDLIAEQLPPVLGEQVAIPSRKQITLVWPGTTKQIGISQWGLNGLKMADPAAVVEQVGTALDAGEDTVIAVPLEKDPFVEETQEPPSNYGEPNGAKWIDVNRSSYVATMYEGTTQVGSFVISIGKPSTPTPTGEYYVYMKYDHQVMRGPASDPYESPTDWVSYFNGGVAFHSAPWNEPNNWQRGVSHGCVNMKTRDAKTVYDFAPVGTKVVVHD
jgi:lipoprotein-anchoring transpeptidase ErfK/SrfK